MDPHGFLVVDKPRGPTSHDVVARVRRLLGTRRVGHAGTLDPAAEGVLLVAVGAATRLIERVQGVDKQYLAHVVLGVEADSGDVEGAVTAASTSASAPLRSNVESALAALTGVVQQVPPAHSAIKVGGEALYHRARRGEEFEVPARTVRISRLTLLQYAYPDALVLLDCGSGVYVRAIARDLGRALGCGAYLHFLLRTRVGAFDIAQAWPLATLEETLSPESWPLMALHPDAALASDDALLLDENAVRSWYYGRPIPGNAGATRATGRVRAYQRDGSWLGVATTDRDRGLWQPRIVIGR